MAKLDISMFKDAGEHSIKNLKKIFDVENIINEITVNKPVVMVLKKYKSFNIDKDHGYIPLPAPKFYDSCNDYDDKYCEQHTLCLVDFDEINQSFTVVAEWTNSKFCNVPYIYFMNLHLFVKAFTFDI